MIQIKLQIQVKTLSEVILMMHEPSYYVIIPKHCRYRRNRVLAQIIFKTTELCKCITVLEI